MLTSIHKSIEELNSLEKLIEINIEEKKILTYNSPVEIDYFLRSYIDNYLKIKIEKEIYNYNSVIISLYGWFERFIESLVITYLDFLQKVYIDYNLLPEIIREQHNYLSGQLYSKIVAKRNDIKTTQNEFISNIYSCLYTPNSYKINIEAFKMHSSNFRFESVDDFFSKVGIANIGSKILNDDSIRDFCYNSEGLTDNLSIKVKIKYYLDELADRRNFVAHGRVDDIFDNSILIEFVKFFKSYSLSLVNVLTTEMFKIEAFNKGRNLGKPKDVFHEGRVIIIDHGGSLIKKDSVVYVLNNNKISRNKVLSIKVNDLSVDEINDVNNNYEVGLLLSDRASKNSKIFIVNSSILF